MSKEIIINGKRFLPYIKKDGIEKALESVAKKITKDFSDKNPVLLTVLKGAMPFAVELMWQLKFSCQLEAIRAKSYGSGMKTSGNVTLCDMPDGLEGRDLIIIEDIVDSGLTIKALKEKLKEYNPRSISAACLLSKPSMRKVEVDVEYIGIEIPPVFVVGYGLDYAESGRNIPCIYALDSDVENTDNESPKIFE